MTTQPNRIYIDPDSGINPEELFGEKWPLLKTGENLLGRTASDVGPKPNPLVVDENGERVSGLLGDIRPTSGQSPYEQPEGCVPLRNEFSLDSFDECMFVNLIKFAEEHRISFNINSDLHFDGNGDLTSTDISVNLSQYYPYYPVAAL